MHITNLTSSVFILSGARVLHPQNSLFIEDKVYLGNSTLKNQIDQLLAKGMINAYEKPADPEIDRNLPEAYEAGSQEFSIAHEGGIASLSVDTDIEGENYGSVELMANGGGEASLKSYCEDEEDALLLINKTINENGNLLSLEIEGIHAMRIGSTGAIGFDGKDPITPPSLNPSTGTTTQIINALIDLGLFREA